MYLWVPTLLLWVGTIDLYPNHWDALNLDGHNIGFSSGGFINSEYYNGKECLISLKSFNEYIMNSNYEGLTFCPKESNTAYDIVNLRVRFFIFY